MTRVSWLMRVMSSTVLLSGIGCGGKTHVVGAVADGSAGGDGGSSTGIPAECNVPPCMTRLLGPCYPSGTCVRQNDGASSSYYCYSNGVEVVSLASGTPTSVGATATKNGSTCWTLRTDAAAAGRGGQVIEDGAGIQVVTLSVDAENRIVITCTADGSSAVLNQACDTSRLMYGKTSSCVLGTCPP
jgi:hypothetical protein